MEASEEEEVLAAALLLVGCGLKMNKKTLCIVAIAMVCSN